MRATYNCNVMWYTREVVCTCIRECMEKYDSFYYVADKTKDGALLNSIKTLRYSKSGIINEDLYATVTLRDRIHIDVFKSSFQACYIHFAVDGAVVNVLVSNKEAWKVLVKLIKSLRIAYVG